MGWFDDGQQGANQMDNYQPDNQASFGHELLAGGAAFAGFKAFEDHQRKEGKQVSHAFAKEVLAGFAGAEVDRFAETKGADWVDRERAKRDAQRHAENMYDEHYVQNQGADQYDPNRYDQPEQINNYYNSDNSYQNQNNY